MEEVQVHDPSDVVGATEALGEHVANPPTPSAGGDALFALGKRWKVSADELRIKGQFEGWVRAGARQAIADADTMQLPEEAQMMRQAYGQDYAAGHYGWDGRACRNARGDIPGMRQLLYLMLYRCHPETHPQPITEALVQDMFDENLAACLAAVMWSLGNFPSSVKRRALRAKAQASAGPGGSKVPAKTETPTLDG